MPARPRFGLVLAGIRMLTVKPFPHPPNKYSKFPRNLSTFFTPQITPFEKIVLFFYLKRFLPFNRADRSRGKNAGAPQKQRARTFLIPRKNYFYLPVPSAPREPSVPSGPLPLGPGPPFPRYPFSLPFPRAPTSPSLFST